MRRFQVKIGAKYKKYIFVSTEFDVFQTFLALIIFSSCFQSIMSPLLRKNESFRLYPKTDFYVFLVSFSAFQCYSVNQTVHFRALVYYCFHVVHSALWSRMWSKLAPLKSTSGHLKIGQSIKTAEAAASRKQAEKKRNVVSPKAANKNMWS